MIAKKANVLQLIKNDFEPQERDFYDNAFLNESLDSDQISAEEQGFMMGYLGDCYV